MLRSSLPVLSRIVKPGGICIIPFLIGLWIFIMRQMQSGG
jgi:hypothetical protein